MSSKMAPTVRKGLHTSSILRHLFSKHGTVDMRGGSILHRIMTNDVRDDPTDLPMVAPFRDATRHNLIPR